MSETPMASECGQGDGLSIGRCCHWVVLAVMEYTPEDQSGELVDRVFMCQAVSAADVQVRGFVRREDGRLVLDRAQYRPRSQVRRLATAADFENVEREYPGACAGFVLRE